MTKDEIQKNSEHWYNKYKDAEKRIAELEEKLANADYQLEGRDLEIKELEKENAELKETLKTYNGCGDWDNDFHTCRVYLQHEELQKCEELLSKAKELLKQWLQTSKASSCDNINIVTNTEQFLKDN